MATIVVPQGPIYPKLAWNSGICDCLQDLNSCCCALWCFPCFMCSTSGAFGESTCLPLLDIFGPGFLSACGIPFCVPPVTLGMRVAIRHKYNIGGSICEDIMVSCCCIWCSWCQMSREIKARKKNIALVSTQPMVQQIPVTTTQVVSTQPMVQQIPVTTTQVVSTQQTVGFGAAPVAVAPAMQMAPTVVQ